MIVEIIKKATVIEVPNPIFQWLCIASINISKFEFFIFLYKYGLNVLKNEIVDQKEKTATRKVINLAIILPFGVIIQYQLNLSITVLNVGMGNRFKFLTSFI